MTEKPWWLPPKLDLTSKVEKESLHSLWHIREGFQEHRALILWVAHLVEPESSSRAML